MPPPMRSHSLLCLSHSLLWSPGLLRPDPPTAPPHLQHGPASPAPHRTFSVPPALGVMHLGLCAGRISAAAPRLIPASRPPHSIPSAWKVIPLAVPKPGSFCSIRHPPPQKTSLAVPSGRAPSPVHLSVTYYSSIALINQGVGVCSLV